VGVAFIDSLMLFRIGCIERIGIVIAFILGLALARLIYFYTPFKAAIVLITLIQFG
jgi:hypothetical protein